MTATDHAVDATRPSAPFRETYFPPADMHVERRADGTLVIEPVAKLEPFLPNFPAELESLAASGDGQSRVIATGPRGGRRVRNAGRNRAGGELRKLNEVPSVEREFHNGLRGHYLSDGCALRIDQRRSSRRDCSLPPRPASSGGR